MAECLACIRKCIKSEIFLLTETELQYDFFLNVIVTHQTPFFVLSNITNKNLHVI